MISSRVSTLAGAALALGLMGGLHDLPKAVPAPALHFATPGKRAKKRHTQTIIATNQKKVKRRMVKTSRRGNRPCK